MWRGNPERNPLFSGLEILTESGTWRPVCRREFTSFGAIQYFCLSNVDELLLFVNSQDVIVLNSSIYIFNLNIELVFHILSYLS